MSRRGPELSYHYDIGLMPHNYLITAEKIIIIYTGRGGTILIATILSFDDFTIIIYYYIIIIGYSYCL